MPLLRVISHNTVAFGAICVKFTEASVNLTQMAPKATVLCEITRSNGIESFKVIQGHRFCETHTVSDHSVAQRV